MPAKNTLSAHGNRMLLVWLAGIVLAAVAVTPTLRAWRARESSIAAARAELRELAAVVNSQPAIDSAIAQSESQLSGLPQRVLQSRSRALAASALQSLVQEIAEASNVTVTRLDVANSADTGDLPITLTANGDIYGLAELLRGLRSARYAVLVEKLQAQNNSALRGAPDVLQIALSLRAPVIVP